MERRRGPRAKPNSEKYRTHNISMPPEVSDGLVALAKAQRLEVSKVATIAVERYLSELRRGMERVAKDEAAA